MSAVELGRQILEGWGSGDDDPVFATFDPDVVVRTDRDWPEGPFFGVNGARSLWRSVRESMGGTAMSVEEEHDLGDRAFWRIHQPVRSPSGVESGYSWSLLLTARYGKVILIEFFIDDTEVRAELGLS